MLLHSSHTFANLALKETVPPQSRISPYVTAKHYIQNSEFRALSVFQGKHKLLENPECEKYMQCSENFQGKLCFSG